MKDKDSGANQDSKGHSNPQDRNRTPLPKYELGVEVFFNARHYVTSNAQKGETHPHSWRVQVKLAGDHLTDDGFLVGFQEAKQIVQSEADALSDRLLNVSPPFDRKMPTTENIASVFYHLVKTKLVGIPLTLVSVCVWESPTNYICYSYD